MIEAFVALVAALVWTAVVTLGSDVVASPSALVAAFGCASATLWPAVVVWRRARPVDPESRSIVHGAMLATFPLTAFGALVFAKTHHRALGGVTFAFVAMGAAVAGALLGRRIGRISRWGRVPSVALSVAALLSVFGVTVWLFGAPSGFRALAMDFLTGSVLLSCAVEAPLERLPGWTKHVAVAGVLAAASGVVLFALNQELRRHLAEAAPVATFVVRVVLL
jgi:hypothetical protein